MSDRDLKINLPTLYLLLAIVDGFTHGYAMGQEVKRRSGGRIELKPASLYWSINRLRQSGLIREVDAPPDDDADGRGRPRRHYETTATGMAVLREEMELLEGAVDFARDVALGERDR